MEISVQLAIISNQDYESVWEFSVISFVSKLLNSFQLLKKQNNIKDQNSTSV